MCEKNLKGKLAKAIDVSRSRGSTDRE